MPRSLADVPGSRPPTAIPHYAFGRLSVQIGAPSRRAYGLDGQLEEGEFGALYESLRTRITGTAASSAAETPERAIDDRRPHLFGTSARRFLRTAPGEIHACSGLVALFATASPAPAARLPARPRPLMSPRPPAPLRYAVRADGADADGRERSPEGSVWPFHAWLAPRPRPSLRLVLQGSLDVSFFRIAATDAPSPRAAPSGAREAWGGWGGGGGGDADGGFNRPDRLYAVYTTGRAPSPARRSATTAERERGRAVPPAGAGAAPCEQNGFAAAYAAPSNGSTRCLPEPAGRDGGNCARTITDGKV